MTSDLILGTPFLTQIYPFYVDEIGLHTKIMGKTISFRFLTAAKQREIANLQSASIYKQINSIHLKQNLVNSFTLDKGFIVYIYIYQGTIQKTLIFLNFFPNPRQNPTFWSAVHTQIIQQVKQHVKSLPCLGIPHPDAFMIVETDASDIGYGGILKQKLGTSNKQLVRFHSGLWHGPQQKCSTIKKEIFSYCVICFQISR